MLNKLYKKVEEAINVINPKSLFTSSVEFSNNSLAPRKLNTENSLLLEMLYMIKENKISSR